MKVVIPAAGLGIRFLPATKSQPKEMLPVLDKPIIQYVVEEAVAAGADDIVIITGRGKRSIEDHFDHVAELKKWSDRPALVALEELSRKASLFFIRQREPLGLADAIRLARRHVGNESFGVLLGDTINVCDPPLLRQLWSRHLELHASVLAVEQVADDKVSDYGIVAGPEVSPGVVRCERLVEKPTLKDAPSRLGITGAYVFTPRLFEAIDRTVPGVNHEIQLTDAIQILAREEPVYGVQFEGTRYDIGDSYLWLKTNLEFAWRDPALRRRLQPELERLRSMPSSSP